MDSAVLDGRALRCCDGMVAGRGWWVAAVGADMGVGPDRGWFAVVPKGCMVS